MTDDETIRKWAKGNGLSIAEDEPIPPAMIKEYNRKHGDSLIESILDGIEVKDKAETKPKKVVRTQVNRERKEPKEEVKVEVKTRVNGKPKELPKESEEEMRIRIRKEIMAELGIEDRPTLKDTPDMTFTVVKGVGPWDLGPELGSI